MPEPAEVVLPPESLALFAEAERLGVAIAEDFVVDSFGHLIAAYLRGDTARLRRYVELLPGDLQLLGPARAAGLVDSLALPLLRVALWAKSDRWIGALNRALKDWRDE